MGCQCGIWHNLATVHVQSILWTPCVFQPRIQSTVIIFGLVRFEAVCLIGNNGIGSIFNRILGVHGVLLTVENILGYQGVILGLGVTGILGFSSNIAIQVCIGVGIHGQVVCVSMQIVQLCPVGFVWHARQQ